MAAKLIGAGLATIALAGAAVGVGLIFAALIGGTARNPSLYKQLFNSSSIPGKGVGGFLTWYRHRAMVWQTTMTMILYPFDMVLPNWELLFP